jgi:nitric oxide reductase subunit B
VTYVFDLFHGNFLLGKEGQEFQAAVCQARHRRRPDIPLQRIDDSVGKPKQQSRMSCSSVFGALRSSSCSHSTFQELAVDKMYWWYVVHLWVEGVWELVMASILAFLMLKLTGVDREVVEKWLYVIVGTSLFSGIPAQAICYWIGTPGCGSGLSIFSTRDHPVLPDDVFSFVMVWKGRRDHPNALSCGRSAQRYWRSSAQIASCIRCMA